MCKRQRITNKLNKTPTRKSINEFLYILRILEIAEKNCSRTPSKVIYRFIEVNLRSLSANQIVVN